ncbi:hypothetical protein [Terasakiella sp. SH-1]|uniref:hypothetical protein n=1 Tax=Terasakiella sp. SH-1 TaxID=2560057 RepID=UPI001073D066|nr:hypothetical protein [Terasakiella sp. SH-1]
MVAVIPLADLPSALSAVCNDHQSFKLLCKHSDAAKYGVPMRLSTFEKLIPLCDCLQMKQVIEEFLTPAGEEFNTRQNITALLSMYPKGKFALENTPYVSALIRAFGRLPEEHMPVLLEAMSQNKPEYAHAAAHMHEGNSDAALAILEGEEIGRLEKQYVPKNNADYKDGILNKLHGGGLVLEALPIELRAGIEKTVRSVYTKLSRDEHDVSGDVDEERLEKAVNIVTGGMVEYDRPGLNGKPGANLPTFGFEIDLGWNDEPAKPQERKEDETE